MLIYLASKGSIRVDLAIESIVDKAVPNPREAVKMGVATCANLGNANKRFDAVKPSKIGV